MLSKYTAILPIFGVLVFLLTARRRALLRAGPWLAALVALAVFSPVIVWNMQNGWASFAFQGARVGASKWNLLGPITVMGGEALFVLPWLWLPMVLVWWRALRRGPGEPNGWLLACLASGPIMLFVIISLWSPRVLFHWAAAGYLFLFPLLGAWLAERRPIRSAIATYAVVGVVIAIALVGVRLNPWPLRNDPGVQALDWTPLRGVLATRGLLGETMAAPNWSDAGKIDYALGGGSVVLCLNIDARQYSFGPQPMVGRDILIIAPRQDEARIRADYGTMFASIETLPPALVALPGRQVSFGLYRGRSLKAWPPLAIPPAAIPLPAPR